MRFTARHFDGFTSRQLTYTLSYGDGLAALEADWLRPGLPAGSVRASFPLDPQPLVRALPALLALGWKYQAGGTDLDHKFLTVESDGVPRGWGVYGGGLLLPTHPELRPWAEVWRWLDRHVEARLPVSG